MSVEHFENTSIALDRHCFMMPGPRKDIHPSFKCKHVMQLDCRYCEQNVCNRGMKAILLSDVTVELYSTDLPPTETVDLVYYAYKTSKCQCKIKDIACRRCGNVIGYAVIKPCKACLRSCNNGHFYMFNSSAVVGMDRLDRTGESQLLWGTLEEQEEEEGMGEEKCELLLADDECIR